MASQPWQRFLSRIVPGFLRGPRFSTFFESLGLYLDGSSQTFLDGIRSANPLTCETDALPLLCKDRRTRWYPTEPEASIRRRLATWRQRAVHAGSAYGLALNLQPYFLPGVIPRIRVVHQAGDGSVAVWYTFNPDGTRSRYIKSPSNWNFDGVTWKTIIPVTGATNGNPIHIDTTNPHGLVPNQTVRLQGVGGNTAANGIWPVTLVNGTQFTIPVAGNGGYTSGTGVVQVNLWSRFWVIIEITGTQNDGSSLYGDGKSYGGGQFWGPIPGAVATDLVAIINDAKRAGSILWGLILAPPGMFDPTASPASLPDGSTTLPAGNWGTIIDPVTHLPTRPAYAVFYNDLGHA